MKNVIISLSFVLAILVNACSGCETQKSANHSENPSLKQNTTNQNFNISIFFDLSDRISPKLHPDPTMEFYKRDIGYISSIAQAFQGHMLKKRVNLMNDKMQVFVDPLPSNKSINDIISKLRISFDKRNVTKEKIESIDSVYTTLSTKLYESAIKDDNYIGADIWGFFKNKVDDYCIRDGFRNILIIFTDGYAYHKDNVFTDRNRSSYLTTKKISQLGLTNSHWKQKFNEKDCGFITSGLKLDDLEVLVLGLNAYKTTPFEEDVIRKYWEKWFEEMGISKYSIKTADLPTNLDGIIKDFLLKGQ